MGVRLVWQTWTFPARVREGLEAYMVDARKRVNRALASVLDEYLVGTEEWLAAPIRYACDSGGKRFRPVLFLACHEVGAGSGGVRVERLATALEIVHSYSLVHDDLPCMDDDDWRRGRPTSHRAFGAERATVAAAAMVPLASWILAKEAGAVGLTAIDQATMVAELSEAAGPAGMVGGQLLDLEGEGESITLQELREIHRRKTGELIRVSARLGARAARVGADLLEVITRYGEKVGIAFQIADDLLDAAAGRFREGGDRALHKATYPVLLGPKRAYAEAVQLAEEAIDTLRQAGIESEILEQLAFHVVERER